MAQPAPAPETSNTITVNINANGVPDTNPVSANVGDRIKFKNNGSHDQILDFPTPPNSPQPYYAVSLLLGGNDKAILYAVEDGTVEYETSTPSTALTRRQGALVGAGPYQIIVGSGGTGSGS